MGLGAKRLACALLMLAALLVPAAALSVQGVDARAGLLWLGNSSTEGAPSPLLDTIGISVPLSIAPRISFAPELDFTGTQYQLQVYSDPTRAVPTEIEFANQVWYLTLLLDLPVRYTLPLSKQLSLGFGLSPALIFRIPTVSYGLGASQAGAMSAYFYGEGRFFYPTTELFLEWQALPGIALQFRTRVFFPVFHLWDGDGLPFWDQMMIDGNLGLRFALR